MFDRSTFWPETPDWTRAHITAPGLEITVARGDRAVFLLGGAAEAISALAAPCMGGDAARLLPIAPDRALLVAAPGTELAEGWHDSGVAVSALPDAHLRFDIRGPGAAALLRRGSMSLALAGDSPVTGAALGFAGVTVLVEQLADGARLHVEHPLAAHIWHWLLAATSGTPEDQS